MKLQKKIIHKMGGPGNCYCTIIIMLILGGVVFMNYDSFFQSEFTPSEHQFHLQVKYSWGFWVDSIDYRDLTIGYATNESVVYEEYTFAFNENDTWYEFSQIIYEGVDVWLYLDSIVLGGDTFEYDTQLNYTLITAGSFDSQISFWHTDVVTEEAGYIYYRWTEAG